MRRGVERLFGVGQRLDSRALRPVSSVLVLLAVLVSVASLPAVAERRALIVGPPDDAAALAAFLNEHWEYPDEAIDVRAGQAADADAASASGIAAALESIRERTSPGDAVVVALSGAAARVAGDRVARRIAALEGRRVVVLLAASGPDRTTEIEPLGGLAALVRSPESPREAYGAFAAATRIPAHGPGPTLSVWRGRLEARGLRVVIPERLESLPLERLLAGRDRLEDIAAEIAETPSDFEVDVELLDPLPVTDDAAPPPRHRLRVNSEKPGYVTLIAVRESGAIALVRPSASAWQSRGRVEPEEPYVTEVPVDAFALTEAGAWVGVIALVCDEPFLDAAPLETDRSTRRRQMIYRKTDRLDEAQLERLRYAHYARLARRVTPPGGDDGEGRLGIGLLRLDR